MAFPPSRPGVASGDSACDLQLLLAGPPARLRPGGWKVVPAPPGRDYRAAALRSSSRCSPQADSWVQVQVGPPAADSPPHLSQAAWPRQEGLV